MTSSKRLFRLLGEVKHLAREYYDLTGRPLGVTAEIAEYEAARRLGVDLSPVRQAGYDAVRTTPDGDQRLQIKGRRILPGSKPGHRVPSVDMNKEWDVVVLVLLDENYEPTEIFEADRSVVTNALTAPGSRARNDRGQLGINKFKSIGSRVWPH